MYKKVSITMIEEIYERDHFKNHRFGTKIYIKKSREVQREFTIKLKKENQILVLKSSAQVRKCNSLSDLAKRGNPWGSKKKHEVRKKGILGGARHRTFSPVGANATGMEKFDYVFGFDCEWQNESAFDNSVLNKNSSERVILSYQFSFDADGWKYDVLFIPDYDPGFPKHVSKRLRLDNCIVYMITKILKKRMSFKTKDGKVRYTNIALVGHFCGVDISAFNTFGTLFKPKDRVRYDKNGKAYTVKNSLIAMNKHILFSASPMHYEFHSFNRDKYKVNLQIRDTMALSSNKSSLSQLGESLGISKLDTKELDLLDDRPANFYKSHMYELLRSHFSCFIEYAMRDARISLEWYKFFCREYDDNITVSAASADYVLSKFYEKIQQNEPQKLSYLESSESIMCAMRGIKARSKEQIAFDYFQRGFKMEFNSDAGYAVETLDIFSSVNRYFEMAKRSYKGGRNECYTHGVHNGKTYDIDIKNAYMTALMCIDDIDYDKDPLEFKAGHEFTLDDFKNFPAGWRQMGFGRVTFEFPDDTKYPSLAMKHKRTSYPIFVLDGDCYVTLQDVYGALLQGAKVTVFNGPFYVLHHKDSRYLAEVIEEMVLKRNSLKKTHGSGSAFELQQKLINNGFYGKTGQGIFTKKVRDFLSDQMNYINFSKVTNPMLAATITAHVRLILTVLIDGIEKNGFDVHSVTTDGFISTLPSNQLSLLNDNARDLMPGIFDIISNVGLDTLVEVKHENDCYFNSRTRLNTALNSGGVFAKGGYRGDEEFKSMSQLDQQRYLFDLAVKRRGRIIDTRTSLKSLYDLKCNPSKHLDDIEFDSEGNPVIATKFLSFDYDFKRYLLSEQHFSTNDRSSYGYYESRPYENQQEFDKYKDIYMKVSHWNHCVKNTDDIELLYKQVELGAMRDVSSKNYNDLFSKKSLMSSKHAITQMIVAYKQNLFSERDLNWIKQTFPRDIDLLNAIHGLVANQIDFTNIMKKAKTYKNVDLFFARSTLYFFDKLYHRSENAR